MRFSLRPRAALLALPLLLCASLPVRAQVAPFTVLHAFRTTDGSNPENRLVPGGPGVFYGTTFRGGANKGGVVYKLTTDATSGGSTLTVLHEFGPPLYSGASADGFNPSGLTLAADGSLYGTAHNGGAYAGGVLFRIAPDGTYSVLHSFGANAADSIFPSDVMQAQDGSLYGISSGGDYGMLFRATLSGTVTVLSAFSVPVGTYPQRSPVQAPDGTFYGVAGGGGANGYGTVYKFTTDGTAAGTSVSVIYSFRGHPYLSNVKDAGNPTDTPLLGTDGALYGTAQFGVSNQGAIYRVTTAGAETVLHSFSLMSTNAVPEGTYPYGPLARGDDGSLYGTAVQGGANNDGTVYRLDAAGRFSLLHTFTLARFVPADGVGGDGAVNGDGAIPYGGVTLGTDGNLYGTAFDAGHRKRGTVFVIPITQFLETDLRPSFAYAGSADRAITVSGTHFVDGAVVRVGGTALPTIFASPGILTATVPASLLTTPAVLDVSVVNPGGTVTTALPFTVKTRLASFTLDHSVVTAGTLVTGTVTLSAPAPVNGQRVQITNNGAYAYRDYPNDGTVFVPAGQTSATFMLHTYTYSYSVTGTLTATAGTSITQRLTVNP